MLNKKDILEAYYFRHACKEFDSGKQISKEDFDFILETGRLSPSSCGLEPWFFLVIEQNSPYKKKLKEAIFDADKRFLPASHFVIVFSRKATELDVYSNYFSHIMKDTHHFEEKAFDDYKNGVKIWQDQYFKLNESPRKMFDWSSKQAYIAMGNMLTSAAMIGIDSCPIEGFIPDKLEEILEKEALIDLNKFGVSYLMAFGYRKNEPNRKKTRQSMNQISKTI
jgi:nitroreductase